MATTLPPPQAYTRDILSAAYEWLRSQPQAIRELANNSDNLVALYMQARRRSGSTLLPPMTEASSETFKQDLRALAEGMKQFEQTPTPTHAVTAVTNGHAPAATAAPATLSAATAHAPIQAQPAVQLTPTAPPVQNSPTHASTNMPTPTLSMPIDHRTFEILRNTQSLCNLGSEREALRMLIAIGYERLRELFPRG